MNHNLYNERFLRLEDVMAKVGLSRSSIYQMIREGKFPPQVQISQRCVAWQASSIDAWMQGRSRVFT